MKQRVDQHGVWGHGRWSLDGRTVESWAVNGELHSRFEDLSCTDTTVSVLLICICYGLDWDQEE